MQPLIQHSIDHHAIARIVLNRPNKGNALTAEMIQQLNQCLSDYSQQKNIRALVLQATGNNFCGGADLHYMLTMSQASADENLADANHLARLFSQLNDFPAPVITLVQGSIFGGGLGLLCCSDIVLAANHSQFCFSDVKLALVAATIMPYVIAAIGQRQARRFLLSAETFNAETAKELGLIHKVLPALALEKALNLLLKNILSNSALAIQRTKAFVKQCHHTDIDDDLIQSSAELIASSRQTIEAQQAIKQFFNHKSNTPLK